MGIKCNTVCTNYFLSVMLQVSYLIFIFVRLQTELSKYMIVKEFTFPLTLPFINYHLLYTAQCVINNGIMPFFY